VREDSDDDKNGRILASNPSTSAKKKSLDEDELSNDGNSSQTKTAFRKMNANKMFVAEFVVDLILRTKWKVSPHNQ
jgi:hypothetical protein